MPFVDDPGGLDDSSSKAGIKPIGGPVKAVRNRIIELILEDLGPDYGGSLDDSTEFHRDLGADCLDELSMQMTLEEEFGVTIPDVVAERIRTIGDLVQVIRERLP